MENKSISKNNGRVMMPEKMLSNKEMGNAAGKRYTSKAVNETLTNGFFSVDDKWKVKYWNKAAETLLKVEAGDIVGKNLWDVFAGTLPVEFYTVYQKAFLQDVPLHFEEYWSEMGAWFDVITYYSDNTLSVSFKSSNHPHSEYPESPLQRLKTLTELYRFVTEITNDCLWEWNLQTHEIFWIDGGHKRVFGYQVENALIPQSFWESRLHPADKGKVLKSLDEMIGHGKEGLWEIEYRFKKADGTYACVHDRGHLIFEDGKAARMIGATQDISVKVLLQNELEEKKLTNLREITSAILGAQEKERMEIGKELHDNLNQTLAGTKMYIELAQKNESKRVPFLQKARALIADVMEDIRRISKNMAGTDIKLIGLSHSIEILLDDFKVINPMKIDFFIDNIDMAKADENLQINIFRIIQEQLNNILKHAAASYIDIEINRDRNSIILSIQDDGKGCNVSKKSSGVGIRNIRSRAELYKGTVNIVSEPGKGYFLKVRFPLDETTAGKILL